MYHDDDDDDDDDDFDDDDDDFGDDDDDDDDDDDIWCIYGSRPKTHARFLVSEWHLQIWMCVFCCSGERPRKRGVRFAKGLNIIIYK